jgi:ATP-dependent Clp protease ATP-binding subunit ClpA
MFNRFAKATRAAVEEAAEIARDVGATSVEAEHLLLAVAQGDSPAARVLHAHGLDFDGLMCALREESTRSLAAVGVSAEPLCFSPFVERPRFGTSAKLALERSLRAALARGDKELTETHLVLGALQPQQGTVPRALEFAGLDRAALKALL